MTDPDEEWHREIEAEAGIALVRADDESIGPWPIPEVLTVFEAAIAYVGGHPHQPLAPLPSRNAPDQERRDHLIFYGLLEVPSERKRRSTGQDLARDIFGELLRRIDSGRVTPVRRADRADSELDPLYTEIPLDAVVDLARERRDAVGPIAERAEVPVAASEGAHEPARTWPWEQQSLKSWANAPEVVEQAIKRRTRENEAATCEALAEMAREHGKGWTVDSIKSTRSKYAREIKAAKTNPARRK